MIFAPSLQSTITWFRCLGIANTKKSKENLDFFFFFIFHVSCITCKISCVLCLVSCVMCHLLHVACHPPLTPTATGTYPPPSPTMQVADSRTDTIFFFWGGGGEGFFFFFGGQKKLGGVPKINLGRRVKNLTILKKFGLFSENL